MTRKDYVLLAEALCLAKVEVGCNENPSIAFAQNNIFYIVLQKMVEALKKDNSRFNETAFRKAVWNVKTKKEK